MHIVLETPGGTGLYLSFNVFGWLIATLLISLGLWQITLNNKVVVSKLQLYSLLGFLCLCVPMFYGSEFSDHAIPRLLGLAGGLLLLFCLYQFEELRKNPQQVLWWILIAVAIQACFGLVQYFILETGDWGGYNTGISRPHGSFLQPNVMASFMATGIAIALYLSIVSKTFSVNNYQQALCYFCLFVATFLVVILQSRAGHLATVLVIAFVGSYLYFKNKKQFSINLIIVFTAFTISLISFDNSEVFKRGQENYQKMGARPNTYLVTAQMIKEQPLTGAGYGLYERSFLDTYNRYVIGHPEVGAAQQRMSHPHNEVLYWVSEGGAVALLGICFFFIAYIKCWLKISNKLAKRLAILGLITPLLLHSQLEFPFYSSISHWFIFIILLWFTDINGTSKKSEFLFDNTFLVKFLAILTTVVFVPFLVTTLQASHIMVQHEKHSKNDIHSFQKITNPIALKERIDLHVFNAILLSGIQRKDKQKLYKYVDWGLKRLGYKPRISIYFNTLLCLKILGESEKFNSLLIEAKQTFPMKVDWEKELSSKLKKPS
jgi:O-antigen polymerase